MKDLYKAYAILGLEPGSTLETINRRYKRLIMVWHPDRFPNDEGKLDAEEELKKINNAKDLLKEHFTSSMHRPSGPCACGAGVAQQSQSGRTTGGPGPGARRTRDTGEQKAEEDAARRRDQERSRRAAEEAKQKAEEAARAAHEESVQTAFKDEDGRKQEPLRLKLALGCAAAFALLLVAPFVSDAFKKPVVAGEKLLYGPKEDTDLSKQLAVDWHTYQSDKAQVAYKLLRREPALGETAQWLPPFVSNAAGADALSHVAFQQLVVVVQAQQKQDDFELASLKNDVQRYQLCIQAAEKKIAECDATLANPSSGAREREFATSIGKAQRQFLQESQDNLKYAQQRLNEVQGVQPTIPTTNTLPPVAPTVVDKPLKSPLNGVDMNPVVRPGGEIRLHDGSVFHFKGTAR